MSNLGFDQDSTSGRACGPNTVEIHGPYTADVTGAIGKFSVRCKTGAVCDKFKIALYADDEGAPGALIGVSAEGTLPAVDGWIDVAPVGTLNVASGSAYWLGVGGHGASGYYLLYRTTVGAIVIQSKEGVAYGSFPDPFGAYTGVSTNQTLSLYATVGAAGPKKPILLLARRRRLM